MNKILIEITLPAAQQTYDIYIPLDSTIREITQLLDIIMRDLAEGLYQPADLTLLSDPAANTVLDMSKTAADLGLKNGSRLLLI